MQTTQFSKLLLFNRQYTLFSIRFILYSVDDEAEDIYLHHSREFGHAFMANLYYSRNLERI